MNINMGNINSIGALRQALPYLKLFQGKTFVIKFGGELFENKKQLHLVFEQISVLHHLGIKIIVVHGGGLQTTALANSLKTEQTFVGGRRVTDNKTLDYATMVLNGTLGTKAVALFRSLGIGAVRLSGVDGHLITAVKRPPVSVDGKTVDFGFVGDIQSIEGHVIEKVLQAGLIPVVSPLSSTNDGQVLNVNADVAASAIATSLKAEKLIFLTDVAGVMEDINLPESLVSYVDVDGLKALVKDGVIQGGMLPKTSSMISALEGGVERVHLITFKAKDTLLTEVFTNEGCGTMVVKQLSELEPAKELEAQV